MENKRKICFVITSFIHYARNLLVLEELNRRADVDLHVLIAGTALLSKYSASHAHVKNMLEEDGFENLYEVYFNLEGDKPVVKAKSTGLGVIEFAALYNRIEPELVVVRGDRFETLSAASAAALMNIPIAHIEGGDVTGTIDESVRHSVSKLSHIHFATNEAARRRLLSMGENPEYVFNFGSPDIEVVRRIGVNAARPESAPATGSGARIDTTKDYIVVSYHPITSEIDRLAEYTRNLIEAIHESNIQAFWFWPNFDAGAEEKISHELRSFNDRVKEHSIRFMRYIAPRQYLALLNYTRCFVGNSSAGIKECAYLGVPVVNVGTRQAERLRGENVLDVPEEKESIKEAIRSQLARGKFSPAKEYEDDNTSKRIAETLGTAKLYLQKSFHEQNKI